jgi:SAM-dependent methyltransferase
MNAVSRERDFHDHTFEDRTRSVVGKFYSITTTSAKLYEDKLRRLSQDRMVLECGCGVRSDAFMLSGVSRSVTSFDVSSVAIAREHERARTLGLRNASFLIMDGQQLAFRNESFDVICGRGILHHLDIHRSFSELARALNPDGAALFAEPLGHNPLINLYRRMTPRLRTVDEHPLRLADLDSAGNYFDEVEVRYFHLSSLAAIPFRNLFFFPRLLKLCDLFDQFLFRFFPWSRRFAWIVHVSLSGPRAAKSHGSGLPTVFGR